jgi:signal transduction histidine kinase
MSGEQLLQELRSNAVTADIPLILLTARAEDELRIRTLRKGANDFLTKPFSTEELLARVNNLVATHQARILLRKELASHSSDINALAQDLVIRKKDLEDALAARTKAEKQLAQLNQELEERVRIRTANLKAANEDLELFNSTAAHDLRAPLRAMNGLADAVLEDYGNLLPPPGQNYLERLRESAQRMDHLIHDMLEYSKVSRQEIAVNPISLRNSTREVLSSIDPEITSKKGEVILNIEHDQVLGHPTLLQQVLGNIIGNALKFVPAGIPPRVQISTELTEGKVRVLVKDNGIGIKPEYQDRLFKMFERLHSNQEFPGTGIGLAIVARAVERMGGSTGLESQPGKGSTFWFELQPAPEQVETAAN